MKTIRGLEGELNGVNNAYAIAAITAVTAMHLVPNDDANGMFGVYVMNLWENGTARQDLLVRVPDGGLTVMLLGIGVGSLALFSRKIRQ